MSAELVRGWVAALAATDGASDGAGDLDLVTVLEELKGAAEGLQAQTRINP